MVSGGLDLYQHALEGNALTRRETALVVEKGLMVGGKSLIEHLEATHHAQALDWGKEKIKRRSYEIAEKDILQIIFDFCAHFS